MDWIDKLRQWIADDNVHAFYVWGRWRKLRREVLAADKGECQYCKARGKYTPATHVHHVNHLRDRPDLALSKTFTIGGEERRQLVSCCAACHEEQHPERMRPEAASAEPITSERWD